jgi:HEPN domain-containing protein
MNAAKKKINPEPKLWIEHAQSDLKLALLANNQDILPEQICFHTQQSVEKSLKAVMLASSVEFPFSHDIQELVETMSDAGIALPDELREIEPSPPML